MVSLTSLGGAGTVTGSKHLIEHSGGRLLVDCGLFQGHRELLELNWHPHELLQRSLGVGSGLERQRRLMPSVAISICEFSVPFLKKGTVQEDQSGNVDRRGRSVYGTAKAVLYQSRQIATVI